MNSAAGTNTTPGQPIAQRVALVTGASRGIGRAVALTLARSGHRVIVNYRRSDDEARALVQEVEALGGQALALRADVGNPDEVTELVAKIQEAWGAVDILVANAGVNLTMPLTLTKPESWRAIMAANLDSAFLLTKAVSRGMVRQRFGRIVYISSDAALTGDLLHAAYSASKAGLLGLAKTAARELAPRGITVNAIAPGPVETAMTADMPSAGRAKLTASIPMGRFGRPEEIAAVVDFLVSEAAAYITGQTLSVDGGLNTKV